MDPSEDPVDGKDVVASDTAANMFKFKAAAKDAFNRSKTIKATMRGPAVEKIEKGLPALMKSGLLAKAIDNERVTEKGGAPELWSKMPNSGWVPYTREGSASVVLGDNFYVFGGIGGYRGPKDNGGRHNDICVFNTKRSERGWVKVRLTDRDQFKPAPRSGHSMTVVGKKIYIFGGEGSYNGFNKRTTYNDMVAFNTEAMCWETVPMFGGPPFALLPSSRRGHSATLFETKSGSQHLLLIGGAGPDRMFMQDVYLNDIQSFDIKTCRWTEVEATGDRPSPRAFHTANFVQPEGVIYVYGGLAPDVFPTKSGPRVKQIKGCKPPSSIFADSFVYTLDPFKMRWSKPLIKGQGPGPRHGHTAVVSPVRPYCIYMFGGRHSHRKPDNQIYILDTHQKQWSCPQTRGAPPKPRYSHVSAAVGNKMLVFGGSGFSTYCSAEIHVLSLRVLEKPPPPAKTDEMKAPVVIRSRGGRAASRRGHRRPSTSPSRGTNRSAFSGTY